MVPPTGGARPMFGDDVGATLVTTLYARAHAESVQPDVNFHDQQAREVWARLVAASAKKGLDDPATLAASDASNIRGTIRRSMVIDRLTWQYAIGHPSTTVVTLGIGLCNRRARLRKLSADFVGVDRPAVIELRRGLIPDDLTNLIGCSVMETDWLSQVPAGGPTLVIAEGLLMYLNPKDVSILLGRIGETFGPGTGLVADVFHPMAARLGHPIQRTTGAHFHSGHAGATGLARSSPGWQAVSDTDLMDESGFLAAQVNAAFRLFAWHSMYSVAELRFEGT